MTSVELMAVASEEHEEFPEIMTPAEAARFLRLGKNGIYDAIKAGSIPSIRVGRRILLSRNSLRQLFHDKTIEERL